MTSAPHAIRMYRALKVIVAFIPVCNRRLLAEVHNIG
jgi:hypothetical protein